MFVTAFALARSGGQRARSVQDARADDATLVERSAVAHCHQDAVRVVCLFVCLLATTQRRTIGAVVLNGRCECSKSGQNSLDELKKRDLKAELLEREERHADAQRRPEQQQQQQQQRKTKEASLHAVCVQKETTGDDRRQQG